MVITEEDLRRALVAVEDLQTAGSILAALLRDEPIRVDRGYLYGYHVEYLEDGEALQGVSHFWAEDIDHAREQCVDAFPGCVVTEVCQVPGEKMSDSSFAQL